VPRPWTLLDFILVVVGGLVGSGLAVGAAALLDDSEVVLVLALAGQYLGHLLVLWALYRRKGGPDLGFTIEGRDVLYLGAGLFLQLAMAVLFLPLTSLLFPDGEPAQQISSALSGLETTAAKVTAIVTAVVIAPVTEELTFRGVLLKSLETRGRRFVMVVTALVFSAFHLLGLDPANMLRASVVVLPQLFVVGLLLAWLTLHNNRLGPAIFLHSGFNLLAAVVLLLPSDLLESVG
jgi:membrane protease YdiL (CAAX protease family)